jgi:hypothetical protein
MDHFKFQVGEIWLYAKHQLRPIVVCRVVSVGDRPTGKVAWFRRINPETFEDVGSGMEFTQLEATYEAWQWQCYLRRDGSELVRTESEI